MTAVPPPCRPADERRHQPGEDRWWGEAWYFDFVQQRDGLRGYVRLGLLPNQDTCWYWAVLVGPERPTIVVIDNEVPLPRGRRLEVRTDGLWADHIVETPFDHFTVGCEAFGLLLDGDDAVPHDASAHDLRGDRQPFGLDLEWETDTTVAVGGIVAADGHYELPCRVHGQILLADEVTDLDAVGQRHHTWGTQQWSPSGWTEWLPANSRE